MQTTLVKVSAASSSKQTGSIPPPPGPRHRPLGNHLLLLHLPPDLLLKLDPHLLLKLGPHPPLCSVS